MWGPLLASTLAIVDEGLQYMAIKSSLRRHNGHTNSCITHISMLVTLLTTVLYQLPCKHASKHTASEHAACALPAAAWTCEETHSN